MDHGSKQSIQNKPLTDTASIFPCESEIPGLVTSSWESPLFNYALPAHDQSVWKSMESICPTEITVYPGDASRAVKLTSN